MVTKQTSYSFIWRLLPTSIDLWLFLGFTFWWACAAISASINTSVDFRHHLLIFPMVVMASLAGIGIFAGLFGKLPRFVSIGAIVFIGITWLCWGFGSSLLNYQPTTIGPVVELRSTTFDDWLNAIVSTRIYLTACILAITFVILQMAKFSLKKNFNKDLVLIFSGSVLGFGQQMFSLLAVHRQRLLVGFLAIALPASILRNALGPGGWVEILLLIFVFCCAVFVLFAVACTMVGYLIKRGWGRLFRYVSAGFVWIFILSLVFTLLPERNFRAQQNGKLYFSAVVISILISISWCWLCKTEQQRRTRRWSLFTPFLILWLVTPWIAFRQKYDSASLFTFPSMGRSSQQFSELLKWSEMVCRVRVESNGAAKLSDVAVYGSSLNVDFRQIDEFDFSIISQTKLLRSIGICELRGVSPTTNLRLLQSLSVDHLAFQGGTLSIDQVSMLLNCPSLKVLAFENVGIAIQTTSDKNRDLVPVARNSLVERLAIQSDAPIENFIPFLKFLEQSAIPEIYIDTPLDLKNFQAVVELSQNQNVSVDFDTVSPEVFESHDKFERNSLRGIKYSYLYRVNADQVRWLAKTGAHASFEEAQSGDDPWAFAFLLPNCETKYPFRPEKGMGMDRGRLGMGMGTNQYLFNQKIDKRELSELAEKHHWVFGRNENENVSHLWLPSVEYIQGNETFLGELETLRLDQDGIILRGVADDKLSKLDAGCRLPSLKRLYIAKNAQFEDLYLPWHFPNLEHLQIPLDSRAIAGWQLPGAFPQLKSIRLFCQNEDFDVSTAAQFAKLPALKKMEIVAAPNPYLSASENDQIQKTIEKAIPNVQVLWRLPKSVRPELSDKLKTHLQQIRNAALENIVSSDPSQN